MADDGVHDRGAAPPQAGLGRRPGDRAGTRDRPALRLARQAARRAARAGLPAGALRLVQPALVDRPGRRAADRGRAVAGAPGPPAAAVPAPPPPPPRTDLLRVRPARPAPRVAVSLPGAAVTPRWARPP